MNKQNIIHQSKIAPNPLEVEYWADLTVDPYGKVIKKWDGSKWIEITDHLDEVENLQRQVDSNRTVAVNAANTANTAKSIAEGRAQAKVFNTFADMENWLKNASNKNTLKVGDNLYIKALEVPDYWVSKVLTTANSDGYYYEISQLETAKVEIPSGTGSEDLPIFDDLYSYTPYHTKVLNNEMLWEYLKSKIDITKKGFHHIKFLLKTENTREISGDVSIRDTGMPFVIEGVIQTQPDGFDVAYGDLTGILSINNNLYCMKLVCSCYATEYDSGELEQTWIIEPTLSTISYTPVENW